MIRWRRVARTKRGRLLLGGAVGLAALGSILLFVRDGPVERSAILDAIRFVESSGRDDVEDGDAGAAIGPFQIHVEYWTDAVAQRPELARGHGYQDCRRRGYAERVVAAYMERYASEAWQRNDAEVIARTHNGGPSGARSPSTLDYWRRVQRALRARG